MLTGGQTCGFAGGSNRRGGHFLVTQGIDGGLCHQNLITGGAMLAGGQTCGFAGGSNRRVSHFLVTQGIAIRLATQRTGPGLFASCRQPVMYASLYNNLQAHLVAQSRISIRKRTIYPAGTGNFPDIGGKPVAECIHITGNIECGFQPIAIQMLGNQFRRIVIQLAAHLSMVMGRGFRTRRQRINRGTYAVILLNHSIGQAKIGMIDGLSLVIPGNIHMVIFSIDADNVPLMALSRSRAGIIALTGHQNRLDSASLQQNLVQLRITLADRCAVNQGAIGVVGVFALRISQMLRHPVVQRNRNFKLGHRQIDAGEYLIHRCCKGILRCCEICAGKQITGIIAINGIPHNAVAIRTGQPKMLCVILDIHIQHHFEFLLRHRPCGIIKLDFGFRIFHTSHDPVVYIQQRGSILHLGQRLATITHHAGSFLFHLIHFFMRILRCMNRKRSTARAQNQRHRSP